jgi:hypothetical protein
MPVVGVRGCATSLCDAFSRGIRLVYYSVLEEISPPILGLRPFYRRGALSTLTPTDQLAWPPVDLRICDAMAVSVLGSSSF